MWLRKIIFTRGLLVAFWKLVLLLTSFALDSCDLDPAFNGNK